MHSPVQCASRCTREKSSGKEACSYPITSIYDANPNNFERRKWHNARCHVQTIVFDFSIQSPIGEEPSIWRILPYFARYTWLVNTLKLIWKQFGRRSIIPEFRSELQALIWETVGLFKCFTIILENLICKKQKQISCSQLRCNSVPVWRAESPVNVEFLPGFVWVESTERLYSWIGILLED